MGGRDGDDSFGLIIAGLHRDRAHTSKLPRLVISAEIALLAIAYWYKSNLEMLKSDKHAPTSFSN
jgi:hypothetical protein